MTYLDYNATAPVWPEARVAIIAALAAPGNPSSVHGYGRAARRLVNEARASVATLLDAAPDEIVFTSGGTEANNLALHGMTASGAVQRILVSAIEHPSVLEAASATELPVAILPVDRRGVLDLEALQAALERPEGKALVAVMSANNETGVIQPIAEVSARVHAHEGFLHIDAVQSAGRVDLSFRALNADSMSVSAHKLGGPAGVGALALSPRASLKPLLNGGGQELRRRAGTENLAGIVGFGVAAKLAPRIREATPQMLALRGSLERRIKSLAPDAVIFGAAASRLPNTICVAIPGLSAETQIMALDLDGVAVSAGSACSSGKMARSHVLKAMGAGDMARDAIRISLGWHTTEDDISRFLASYGGLIDRARKIPIPVAVGA